MVQHIILPWLCNPVSVRQDGTSIDLGLWVTVVSRTSLPSGGRYLAYMRNTLCWVQQKQRQK